MKELVFGRRYRVIEKIGSGGMAEVYKAVDDVLGRTVAVKVLHAQYASDPGFVARFRQEAQAAANLSSPNIVNIFDWGRDDETYYIVMEYVHGTDLKALVQEKGPDRPAQGRRVRSPGLRGPDSGARLRHHPPRHQATEHRAHPRRRRSRSWTSASLGRATRR